MSTINIDLAADTILNVMIGQQDENEVREVVFDFSGWYTTYGSGTISLAIQRPKDEWPYEGTLTVDSTNHKATWEISDTDTAYAGTGQIQLSYKVGDAKKKSVVYRFTCHKSLGALGSVVTPVQIQTFIDEVEEALQTMDGKLDDMEDEITDVKADLQSAGMSEDFKLALHNIMEKVAYIDGDGQEYLDALDDAMWTTVKLTSISCVYTQSGVVYDTDSLDSLRTDLIVTAHYSDYSTLPVTTYSLIGELVAGTSTIIVSYGGKTTTFDVTVTQLLPTGYTKLAYVTANGNQYVDIGLNETQVASAEYEISVLTGKVGSYQVNGFHILSSLNNYFPLPKGNTSNVLATEIFFLKRAGTEHTIEFPWSYNTIYKISAYVDNSDYVKINGSEQAEVTAGATASASNSYKLFTYGGGDNAKYRFWGNLYTMKIYDANGDLVRNLIPAKNSSNVAGLYDIVNDVFYTSATNTALIAGEVA